MGSTIHGGGYVMALRRGASIAALLAIAGSASAEFAPAARPISGPTAPAPSSTTSFALTPIDAIELESSRAAPAETSWREEWRAEAMIAAVRSTVMCAAPRAPSQGGPVRAIASADIAASMSAIGGASPSGSSSSGTPINHRGKSVAAAPVRYFENFENAALGREWDGAARFDKDEVFGRYAGPFRNASQAVNLLVEPGKSYVLKCDLYFIGAPAQGEFQILIDGVPMLDQSFAQLRDDNQLVNGSKPSFNPAIIRDVQVPFRAGPEIVEVVFVGASDTVDGMWGLDNVQVSEEPEQPLGSVGGGGAWPLWGALNNTGGSSPDGFADYRDPLGGMNGGGGGGDDGGGGGGGGDGGPPREVPAPGGALVLLGAMSAMAQRRRRS